MKKTKLLFFLNKIVFFFGCENKQYDLISITMKINKLIAKILRQKLWTIDSLIVHNLAKFQKCVFLILLVTVLMEWKPVFMKVNVLILSLLKENWWDPVRFSANKDPLPNYNGCPLITWVTMFIFVHLIFRTPVHFFFLCREFRQCWCFVAHLSISYLNRNWYNSLLLTLSQAKL